MSAFYTEDLAFIHHAGFGDFARAAAPEMLALLRDSGWSDGLVVDIGCGTGILAHALLDGGFEVLGVDVSPAMIVLAGKVAPEARFITSSCYDAELPTCVAIVAIGEGLTYITEQDPKVVLPDFFSRAFDALVPGGVLLFDLIVGPLDGPMKYRSTQQGSGWQVDVEVDEAPEDSMLSRQITIRRQIDGGERVSKEVHRARTFSPTEVLQLLAHCGFSAETHSAYGALPLPPRRLAFIGRKPGA